MKADPLLSDQSDDLRNEILNLRDQLRLASDEIALLTNENETLREQLAYFSTQGTA